MKKFNFSILVTITALLVLFIACGESEEEIKAREQAEQVRLDSMRMAKEQEAARRLVQIQDSIAAAKARLAAEELAKNPFGFEENGNFSVQLGAWRSEEKAQRYMDQWADRDYPMAYVLKIGTEEDGEIWFRVRVGNFGTRSNAENFGVHMAKEINSTYWVITAK